MPACEGSGVPIDTDTAIIFGVGRCERCGQLIVVEAGTGRALEHTEVEQPVNSRLQDAIDIEMAKLARVQSNIDNAVASGQISEHDGEERKARREQETANRIAFISGEPRPKQRERFPLDDPHAGHVG